MSCCCPINVGDVCTVTLHLGKSSFWLSTHHNSFSLIALPIYTTPSIDMKVVQALAAFAILARSSLAAPDALAAKGELEDRQNSGCYPLSVDQLCSQVSGHMRTDGKRKQ